MLSLLKDSNIELPDTASISQIRTAYEAIVSAADIMDGQTHGVFQHDANGSPDTEKHVETAKDDERDDDEQKGEATRTRTDNVVGAQCGESDEKVKNPEFLERELQLARIKLQVLQLQLQVGEVNDKSRTDKSFGHQWDRWRVLWCGQPKCQEVASPVGKHNYLVWRWRHGVLQVWTLIVDWICAAVRQ